MCFHPLIESGYAASLPAAAIRYALSFDGMSIVLIGVSGSEQIVDATSAAAAGPLPPDALLVNVLRGEDAIIPHGQTVLQCDDKLIVMTSPESHGQTLRALTGEER